MSDFPDSDAEVDRILKRALTTLRDRRPLYEDRSDYYTGKNAEVIAHPGLSRLMGKYTADGHFRLTYAAVPVDALMDRVDLSGLAISGDDENTKRLKAALWDENELDDDADDFHTKAGYLGDYYALVRPVDPEDGTKGVRLNGKHPFNAVIIYDREDSHTPEAGWYQWRTGDDAWRGNLVFDDIVVEYLAKDAKDAPTDPQKWDMLVDEDGEPSAIDIDYGFSMVHYRPDSKPYGTPVNERAYGPQDAITKLNATDMAGVDHVGFPQRYALLDPAAEMDDDIADDFNDQGTMDPPDASTDASTAVSKQGKLDSTPGSAWLLSGVKAVGQFDAGEATQFSSREEFQIRSMATLTRTPLYEFNPNTTDAPSGEARRRADAPITKHAAKIQGTFGRTWAQVGTIALAIMGIGEGKEVTATWLPTETATDKDGLELVGLKTANGVPLKQALREAGYTTEQVDEWWPDSDGDTAVSVGMLKDLASALQSLGSAKTTGAITDEDIRNIIPWLITTAVPEPEPPLVMPGAPVGPDGTPATAQVPTGKFNADGTPEVAPPKGVVPPGLAGHMLPPKA